ncbi:MAG: FtsQ-type POTRA domain-containing protein, partial [Chloroflexi bacterium]|nr:FtsQ-type POTRA domain-containing protein [Chloroflexota bacterium]
MVRTRRPATFQQRHPVSLAEQRAVRAAALSPPREPWLPPGFLGWALGRALALAILVAAAWAVYACASSERFTVRSVSVQGNALLSQSEVDTALGVKGVNIFWLDRQRAAARLLMMPAVQRADVEA